MATDLSKMTCPNICPSTGKKPEKVVYKEAGESRNEHGAASPYIPGMIQPLEPKVYPPGAPPRYLPQPTDSTSGDILTMSPIGPWAAGHMDWTPQAGTTGVRPVVDKYSITRYSTGEWRKNNENTLSSKTSQKAIELAGIVKNDVMVALDGVENKLKESNKKLEERVKVEAHWKKKVEKALHDLSVELETLEENRVKLKGACRILMLPEAISRECLELRTGRYEPDLVRDEAEQELIKEVSIVGEIRRIFMNTLTKVEIQLEMNKAAKALIEYDWGEKMTTLQIDRKNLTLTPESSILQWHKGVVRWPENGTSLEYWEHYCAESIRNCEEVRQKSADLRNDLMTAIIKGGQDLKIQGERTNAALAETVAATQEMCEKLQEKLKETLQSIADTENLLDFLIDSFKKLDDKNKLVMTRIHGRNYERLNVENCRDEAQYALMDEAKFIQETTESLVDRIRQAEAVRADLMQYRGQLEKDIACKRKSLSIDQDRCARIRAHMPSPEEFAGA